MYIKIPNRHYFKCCCKSDKSTLFSNSNVCREFIHGRNNNFKAKNNNSIKFRNVSYIRSNLH